MPHVPALGAQDSPRDIRTFSYPTKAYPNIKGGKRYDPADIEDQDKVGICTAISLTQNAKKALGRAFSADFQYLIQKKYYDGNWDEGSSIFSALKAAKGIGLLPAEMWTYTTQEDRKLPYDLYIAKLKAVPGNDLAELILKANHNRLKAYASVPVNRDALARAIDESKSGILVRFLVSNRWFTDAEGNVTWDKDKLEPLTDGTPVLSGHAIIESNYNGGSFRVANTWSKDWCDGGTAYHILKNYRPTEAWIPYFNEVPTAIQAKLDARATTTGKIMDALHNIVMWIGGLLNPKGELS